MLLLLLSLVKSLCHRHMSSRSTSPLGSWVLLSIRVHTCPFYTRFLRPNVLYRSLCIWFNGRLICSSVDCVRVRGNLFLVDTAPSGLTITILSSLFLWLVLLWIIVIHNFSPRWWRGVSSICLVRSTLNLIKSKGVRRLRFRLDRASLSYGLVLLYHHKLIFVFDLTK
jgi:hypothetical protein